MIKRIGTALLAGLALASSAGCSGGEAAGDGIENTGSVAQALRHWEPWSGPNFSAFDVNYGLACAQFQSGNTMGCVIPVGAAGRSNYMFPGWSDPNNVVPGGIKSIALGLPYMGTRTIYVLGTDSVVRYTSGAASPTEATWRTGTNFKTFTNWVPAKLTTGTTLCVKKIAVIVKPSLFAPSTNLIGLSCTGELLIADGTTGWKKSGSAGAPWSQLPADTFADISHGPQGAYLASASGDVLRVGTGTALQTGDVTWTTRWLPNLPNGLKAKYAGGRYVITNAGGGGCTAPADACPGDAQRVYYYDETSNTWQIPPGIFMPNADLDVGDNVVPWKGIVDGQTFRNTAGNIFLWHMYQRIYEWIPN